MPDHSEEFPSPKQAAALAVLAIGDASIEGHPTTADHGGIVHHATAHALEAKGWAESYEAGRIGRHWMLRITPAGRAALSASSEEADRGLATGGVVSSDQALLVGEGGCLLPPSSARVTGSSGEVKER